MKPKKLRKLYAAKLRWEQKKMQRPFWNDSQLINYKKYMKAYGFGLFV
jgi:hypothetical protein